MANLRVWKTAVTVESDGKVSGLTEMWYDPKKRTIITQNLTGVPKEYQGKGKGKWLKAAMLIHVKKEYPELEMVETWNATVNAPMIHINENLGFKVHKEVIVAQISTDEIDTYLSKYN